MTTKITVDAHAGWPVSVMIVDPITSETIGEPIIVAPGTVQEFYIHSGQDIHAHEIQPERPTDDE